MIVSYSNNGYFDFAKLMLTNLNQRLLFHKVHFYCLDEEIYQKVTSLSLPNIIITFELVKDVLVSKNYERYGSSNYNSITHTKMNLLSDALKRFHFIHFIDCDVICIREPLKIHYEKYAEYDIVFQHDAGMYSAEKLHAHTLHHIWCCTGNMSLRDTPGCHLILDKIVEYQNQYQNKNDQECLYQYFQDIGLTDIRNYEQAKLYTYEIAEYTNGYWFSQNIGTLDQTYFFHANHVVGKENKLNLLIRANPGLDSIK